MELSSLLAETALLLGLAPFSPDDKAFSLEVGEGETVSVSVDLTDWPLVRLYRGMPLPLHGDEVEIYRGLLEWNMEHWGPSLACDEGGALYLVQSLQGPALTPQSFAQAINDFGAAALELRRLFEASPVRQPEAYPRGWKQELEPPSQPEARYMIPV